jgi:hypothetical protein
VTIDGGASSADGGADGGTGGTTTLSKKIHQDAMDIANYLQAIPPVANAVTETCE